MTIIYTRIEGVWDEDRRQYITTGSESFEYSGPMALACGASDEQKSLEAKQSSFYDTMTGQAKEVFGDASSVFKDLMATFAPIVAAGPNQHGFSVDERNALNTQATEGTAQTYEHASKALGAAQAARGGGNEFIPSGADEQLRQEVATSAAQNEAGQKNRIVENDFATGRDNYFRAASGLSGATQVFNPAANMANEANTSGKDASDTANQIAQEDNSWVSAVTGMVGSVGGAAIGGYTQGLGQSKGSGGTPGCWIAEAIWGTDDPRTHLVREWLNTEFNKTVIGKIVMALYLRFGQRIAAAVRKSGRLRRALTPLFEKALVTATAWKKDNQ